MNTELLLVALAGGLLRAMIAGIGWLLKKRRKPLDRPYFEAAWTTIQQLTTDRSTWPLAIINADKLLDEALKKSAYKGKSMGERLAAAQKELSNKDSVWYGHKLRNRLVHESDVLLSEKDVTKAMAGLRQALRDLGAVAK